MAIPQLNPDMMQQAGMTNPFLPPQPPPPSPTQGFQTWASAPENSIKVAPFMTQPNQPMQPAAANPPAPQMASVQPPSSFASIRSAATAPPEMTPDVTAPISLPNAAPPVMRTAQPNVQSQAQTQYGADQQRLSDLQTQGAGLNKIQNPFLRGLARVGDIAAPFLLGGGAMAIPGTTAHNLWLQNRQHGQVSADQQALNDQIDNLYKQAQTQNILNPRDKFQPIQTANGYGAFDPATGTATPVLDSQGNPLAPPDKTTEHWTVSPDYTGPNGEPVEVEQNSGQMRLAGGATSFKRAKTPAETSAADDREYERIKQKVLLKQPITDQERASMEAYRDRKTIGQQVTNVYANQRGEQKADVQLKQATAKEFQPAMDSAERFDVMTQSYEDAIKDPSNQQAMLNLLANHLGMTMGLQKGARLNQAMIDEAQKSQPWLAGIKAKFGKDGYMTGVTLSPNQMRQMVDLGRGRFAGDVKKARSNSQYLGATDDGPKRDPSDATQKMYLSLAGKDPVKARQMMKDDGWTF